MNRLILDRVTLKNYTLFSFSNVIENLLFFLREHEIKIFGIFAFVSILTIVSYINNLFKIHKVFLSEPEKIQQMLSILWIVPLPLVLASLFGIILYRKGAHLHTIGVPNIRESVVYFRLVTKGKNIKIISSTVRNIINTIEAFNKEYATKTPYVLEVITESPLLSLSEIIKREPSAVNVRVIQVPDSYETRNMSLYKARGLHYAIEQSKAKSNDWIFHLDEESQINKFTVLGILDYISKEEDKIARNSEYKPRIGQGTILYHRNLTKHPLLTLADYGRTGDDVGRFYLQNFFQVCIFGMHGSFILVRNSLEQQEGFDLTPENCVTEDAYWGLRAAQKGYRFGHVYGFLHEQGTEKPLDFIKQRRRWFLGLTKVLQAGDISMQYKFSLLIVVSLWSLSWLTLCYTIFNYIHPVPIPEPIVLLATFTFSVYILVYVIGFYLNIKHNKLPLYRKILFFIAQILFIPIFSALEGAGVFYGSVNRKVGFHVISK